MREGPARSYETTDAYGLRFVGTGPLVGIGWTAITDASGADIAYFRDGVMATMIRDLMNRAVHAAK